MKRAPTIVLALLLVVSFCSIILLARRRDIVAEPLYYTSRPPTAPLRPELDLAGNASRSNLVVRVFNDYGRSIWIDYVYYEFRQDDGWEMFAGRVVDEKPFLADEQHCEVVPPHSSTDLILRTPDFDCVWRFHVECHVPATRAEHVWETVAGFLRLPVRHRIHYVQYHRAFCYWDDAVGPSTLARRAEPNVRGLVVDYSPFTNTLKSKHQAYTGLPDKL
jgi:hypothetical protein